MQPVCTAKERSDRTSNRSCLPFHNAFDLLQRKAILLRTIRVFFPIHLAEKLLFPPDPQSPVSVELAVDHILRFRLSIPRHVLCQIIVSLEVAIDALLFQFLHNMPPETIYGSLPMSLLPFSFSHVLWI